MNETTEEIPPVLCDGSPAMTPDQLLEKLDAMGFETVTHDHVPVFTVEASQEVTAQIPGAHTKNLFVKDKKDNFFLIVAANDARIPLNRVHTLIGAQTRVSFGKPDKLMAYLGVRPGSVNAFCPINDHGNRVKVIIDAPLLENDMINCHPLINDRTTTISKTDLLRFLETVDHPPLIVQISEAVFTG